MILWYVVQLNRNTTKPSAKCSRKFISLTSNTQRRIGGEVIVKKFSNNILDNSRRERILLNVLERLFMSRWKPAQVLLILNIRSTRVRIGETNRHFATRIREHLASDKNSHIFKHLRGSENCRSLCSADCFKILDSAPTSFQLKIKEAMQILWEQPSLNSQVKHLKLSLS